MCDLRYAECGTQQGLQRMKGRADAEKHNPCHLNQAGNWGWISSGLLSLKWLVHPCILADQPWDVRPQAARPVTASKLAVEVEEGGMGDAAPAEWLPQTW
jgi:hypothetical protein